jgi:hypothetical protein
MRFGTWNISTLYRSGPLITAAREIPKYKLDLVGVQEVIWERDGTEPAGNYTSFYGNENHELRVGTGFFLYIRESSQQLRGYNLLVI